MQLKISGAVIDSHADDGADLFMEAGTLHAANAIGQRSTADFGVIDVAGSEDYEQGVPVGVFDDTGTLAFGGVISSSDPTQPAQGDALYHALQCADWHYLADKRRAPASYASQTAGYIANDIIAQFLAAEGVYAVRNILSANQSSVETNTTGFTSIHSATLTRDTGEHWQGAASLKVVTPGSVAFEGVEASVAIATYVAGATYVASVYLKGSGSLSIVWDNFGVGNVGSVLFVPALTSAWQRYSVSLTIPAGLSGTLGLKVTTSGTAAQTWYCDGWQIEPAPSGTTSATVNLLNAQQSDIEGADLSSPDFKSGLGAGGGLARDTSTFQHGAASLAVTSDATGTFHSVSINAPASSFAANGAYTFSAYMKAASGTPTLRFYCQANDLIAGNTSLGSVGTVTLNTTWTRYAFTITMPADLSPYSIIGIRVDTGSSALAITWYMDAMQIEAGNTATPFALGGTTGYQSDAAVWELGGTTTIQAGPTVTEFTSNYATCAACFDALAQAASFFWQIDAQKRFWFAAPGTVTGPNVTADIIDRNSLKVQRASPLYRNRQFVLGGKAQTASQVETRVGDGTTTAFTMSYAVAKAPTVEVQLSGGAFVSKTVGIGALDTGKDFYWNGGSNVIFQDSSGTKLRGPTGTVDTLRVTYTGEFPTIIQADDVGEQVTTLAREGAGTGIVEEVLNDSNLSTIAAGFELAAGFLSRYAQLGQAVTFRTDQPGFGQGQMVDVHLPAFKILHKQMLIESVTIGHDGLTFWYTCKALVGPYNQSWVQFFAALVEHAVGTVDKINLGTGSTLTLLQSFTATKAPTATFTTTVYACPIFPMVFPFTLC